MADARSNPSSDWFPIGGRVSTLTGRIGTILRRLRRGYVVQFSAEHIGVFLPDALIPLCVDCGCSIHPQWNGPTGVGADGTNPADDDPLCARCFDRRHGPDAVADRAESLNEDRIWKGR